MTISWDELDSVTQGEGLIDIGDPPFTADGNMSPTIPSDHSGLQTARDQFTIAGWDITGDSILTTSIQTRDWAYPILIGAARSHRLQRIWIAAPALIYVNADDTRFEHENFSLASWFLLQRHLPKEMIASNFFCANPFLVPSDRPYIPMPIDPSQGSQPKLSQGLLPIIQVGIRLVLGRGQHTDMDAPWCAYAIAHALQDLQTLYTIDPERFRETFGEIRPLKPSDDKSPVWSEELMPFKALTDINRDLAFLAYEGEKRFRNGTDQGAVDGKLLLREAAAGDGERAGAAINTLVFSCLDTKRQRIEAISFLLKGVLQEQSFESWNSLSNLSTLLLESDETWAGVCLAQMIFELDDLRLDSESSFLLGQAAMQFGIPGVARHYLNIGLTRNPANYENRIREALQQLPTAEVDLTTDDFKKLIDIRLPKDASNLASQVAQLIDLLSVDTAQQGDARVPEHPYIALAEKSQRSGNSPAHVAFLAMCAVEAPQEAATYAYSKLMQSPRWKSTESQILRAATHLMAPFPLSQSTWIEIASVAASSAHPDLARHAISAALDPETPKSHISLPLGIEAVQIAASVSPDEVARESLLAVLRNSPHKAARFAYLNVTHDEQFLEQALRSDDTEQAEAAAKNPYVNASDRTGFWDEISSDLAWIVASTETTRSTTLKALSSHASDSVRRAVARNPRTPAKYLLRLASDQAWAVREAVLSNPEAPDEARAAATLLNN